METPTAQNNGRGARFLRTALVLLIVAFGLSRHVQAQLISPITLNYSFSVPVAKVVPNACTSGFVLIDGTISLNIRTIEGGQVPFSLTVTYASTGNGQDALADGTLILNGKLNYVYSSQTGSEAGFPEKPQDFGQTVGIRDYLVRSSGDKSDQLLVETVLDLTFTNGVPSAPVLEKLNISCSAGS